MESDLTKQIERWGWGILGVSLLATLSFGFPQQSLGITVGGVFSLLNFRGIRVFSQILLQRKRRKKRWIEALGLLMYLSKYTIITIFFFYLIKYHMVDLVFFLLGLSIMVVAIIGVGIAQARTSRQEDMWKG